MPDVKASSIWRQVLLSRGLLVIILVVMFTSAYVNLSNDITDKRNYRYFPPFEAGFNRNLANHLGAEHLNIARAICDGRGFSDPFGRKSGPTAWMPPVLPYLLAATWSAADGNIDVVTNIFVCLHCIALVWTAIFVLYAWNRERPRAWMGITVCIFLLEITADFRNSFQITHDHFLVLSVMNGLVLWTGWGRPLASRVRSFGWGLFGGFAALVTPTLGLVWAGLTVTAGVREKKLSRIGLAGFGAAVALTPWVARNYETFGRFIPVKSNVNFELYQSQCMQPDGTLQQSSIGMHPQNPRSEQGREYDKLGESAFLARKGEQFWTSFREDPGEFFGRVLDRFETVIVWYTLRQRNGKREFLPGIWLARVLHPLPWVAVAVIALSIGRRSTHGERTVAAAAVLYVFPYILVSYDERYYAPLLGLRVLLVAFLVERLINRGKQRFSALGSTESLDRKVGAVPEH